MYKVKKRKAHLKPKMAKLLEAKEKERIELEIEKRLYPYKFGITNYEPLFDSDELYNN